MKTSRVIVSLAAIAVAAAGVGWFVSRPDEATEIEWLTVPVNTQTLTQTASGTGTITTLYTESKDVVTVAIGERDIPKVEEDQTALVTLDAFEETFEGTVYSIASTPSQSAGTITSYDVVIKIDELPDGSKVGMSLSADITLNEVADALTVPASAVTTRGGASIVRVLVDGAPQPREVELGIEGDTSVQVLSGLQPGDEIIIGMAGDLPTGEDGGVFPGRPGGDRPGNDGPAGGPGRAGGGA